MFYAQNNLRIYKKISNPTLHSYCKKFYLHVFLFLHSQCFPIETVFLRKKTRYQQSILLYFKGANGLIVVNGKAPEKNICGEARMEKITVSLGRQPRRQSFPVHLPSLKPILTTT
jgi:hypothetical protein